MFDTRFFFILFLTKRFFLAACYTTARSYVNLFPLGIFRIPQVFPSCQLTGLFGHCHQDSELHVLGFVVMHPAHVSLKIDISNIFPLLEAYLPIFWHICVRAVGSLREFSIPQGCRCPEQVFSCNDIVKWVNIVAGGVLAIINFHRT